MRAAGFYVLHISQCFSGQFMNFLWARSQIPRSPSGRWWVQYACSGAARSVDEYLHSTRRKWLNWFECLRWRIFTTLILMRSPVSPQNCINMLRILTFVVQFPNQVKEESNKMFSVFFGATFDLFWAKFEQLFGKSRANCGISKIISVLRISTVHT